MQLGRTIKPDAEADGGPSLPPGTRASPRPPQPPSDRRQGRRRRCSKRLGHRPRTSQLRRVPRRAILTERWRRCTGVTGVTGGVNRTAPMAIDGGLLHLDVCTAGRDAALPRPPQPQLMNGTEPCLNEMEWVGHSRRPNGRPSGASAASGSRGSAGTAARERKRRKSEEKKKIGGLHSQLAFERVVGGLLFSGG